MADIFDVADIIDKMASGFEETVMKCLDEHSEEAVQAVKDQLNSGLRGDDSMLTPNYNNDPWFDSPDSGRWYKNRDGYKAFKWEKTPPTGGMLLLTPNRTIEQPNLIVTGERFHDLIAANTSKTADGYVFTIDAKGDEAEDIKKKWGDATLQLGSLATTYFCFSVIEPRIWQYFEECGW